MEDNVKTTMTIYVDEDVKRRFKALCALEDVSISAKVNALMDEAAKAAEVRRG